ncbi:NAD-dependent epimerase/dehydratase family protein [Leptospira wolffii]|uniref:NAD-dependent epimerase/dehydratase family protein n=1 Tax=Leptospira wolffii TaxID=409998 RepID=UPI001083D710|nr:NAD-dependent epimerase/dehydratase family protein [Leptospira wolffii]TGK55907.1 NAD-dependent epimerase/dehydratase family protein [Leptospira wolffii]TGK75776.1 NAD-dependent epimerase/dehydratase family protein [Leptospira wolffii]TGK75898.1 NAD-dependent epimerase/dehydratase family protein [Leptospira wolffii]TGL27530.1 NAD-dependent epimerase/dehydratase family protein [Leptospira wolffii]
MKVIITGATGMVGEGVLQECLEDPKITEILIVNRKPSGKSHSKLKEIVHSDFYDLSPIEDRLKGYDACFFCLGVSSIGLSEEVYHKLTHTLTLGFASVLAKANPKMSFCYISGAGTDSTEKGKTMWARVKGKTENDLTRLPFAKVYLFRPGYMHPTPGLKNTLPAYKYITWAYPILKTIFPNRVSSLKELGLAMIAAVSKGYDKNIIEVSDIHILAKG